MNQDSSTYKMLIPGISAWISGDVDHWEQVPGSLGGCPGTAGVFRGGMYSAGSSLILAGFAGCLPWVNLRIEWTRFVAKSLGTGWI